MAARKRDRSNVPPNYPPKRMGRMAPAPPASQCAMMQLSITVRKEALQCRLQQSRPLSGQEHLSGLWNFGGWNYRLQSFAQTITALAVLREPVAVSHWYGGLWVEHYCARQFQKLGHEVRLMPAMYMKAYVKRGKSDAIDAEAICEAAARPTMRFVAIKTEE